MLFRSGYQTTGWTIDQAAQALKISVDEVMIMERDVWLGIGYLAVSQPAGLLRSLLYDHLHDTPLNHSATITLRMFEQGLSLEQISQKRHLKLGTIREHILEAAIFMPGALPLDRLLTPAKIDQLAAQYHGKPATWEFLPPIIEPQSPAEKLQNEQSFFEYRLFQIIKGGERNG